MQQNPLLEKLDWFFTSPSWSTYNPASLALPLAKPLSDHLPCMIQIDSVIPKSKLSRFENFWLQHSDCKDIFQHAWNIPVGYTDAGKRLNAKFKNLRRAIKH